MSKLDSLRKKLEKKQISMEMNEPTAWISTGNAALNYRLSGRLDVGKNETYILQGIGRGLRLDGVHNSIELIDIHARTKYSMRHLKERLKIYKNESYEAELEMQGSDFCGGNGK